MSAIVLQDLILLSEGVKDGVEPYSWYLFDLTSQRGRENGVINIGDKFVSTSFQSRRRLLALVRSFLYRIIFAELFDYFVAV